MDYNDLEDALHRRSPDWTWSESALYDYERRYHIPYLGIVEVGFYAREEHQSLVLAYGRGFTPFVLTSVQALGDCLERFAAEAVAHTLPDSLLFLGGRRLVPIQTRMNLSYALSVTHITYTVNAIHSSNRSGWIWRIQALGRTTESKETYTSPDDAAESLVGFLGALGVQVPPEVSSENHPTVWEHLEGS